MRRKDTIPLRTGHIARASGAERKTPVKLKLKKGGVAEENFVSAELLLEAADKALYDAKGSGRNQVKRTVRQTLGEKAWKQGMDQVSTEQISVTT